MPRTAPRRPKRPPTRSPRSNTHAFSSGVSKNLAFSPFRLPDAPTPKASKRTPRRPKRAQ
eukprot:8113214-Pyramimonas_sp.AAC.1